VNRLPPAHPLAQLCRRALGGPSREAKGEEVVVQRLPASRAVFRFTFPEASAALVGKFFSAYPPATAQDRSLQWEFHWYQDAAGGKEVAASGSLPRCLGQAPELKLGLLLEAVDGPDLDCFLAQVQEPGGAAALHTRLRRLARLLARFHNLAGARQPVAAFPAFSYLNKLMAQLSGQGLLSATEAGRLASAASGWERLFRQLPDDQVVLHGDVTPTNFLFPDGKAVALDLERLRPGDRLFDLGWLAGELKHAFAWRFQDFGGATGFIAGMLTAYVAAVAAGDALSRRLSLLSPFYAALAELRIARNAYLPWDYRRRLVDEAINVLSWGRRTP
jgi:hypothetical protein